MRRVIAGLGDAVLWLTAVTGIAAVALSAVLWFSGARPIVVTSGSMEPTYHVQSVVIVHPVAANRVERGDVVALSLPSGQRVLHRVVHLERTAGGVQVTTKGDANRTPDPDPAVIAGTAWRAGASVPIVGELVAAMRTPLAGFALALLCLGPIAAGRNRRASAPSAPPGPAVA